MSVKVGLSLLALVAAAAISSVAGQAAPRHVRSSSPAAEAIIHGRHAEYVIRFDGPVDHQASRMQITQNGRVVQLLAPLLDSAADVLFAGSEVPAPGRYLLHWVARSSDGDNSSGDIPFSVAP